MNNTKDYELTILIPVYNEKDNMERLQKEVAGYLQVCPVSVCALFVDDGSTDGSLYLIREICQNALHCYYIGLEVNKGLSAALKAGIDVTYSRYVGYMDADMQTDIRDFDLLLEYIPRYHLVTGIRKQRHDSYSKLIQSRIANSFRRMLTHDGATDTGCPLKILHTDCAKRIPFFTGMHRFLPALIKLQKDGCYYEVPVRHYPRCAGVSKYHLWNRLIRPLVDCFAYRWISSRYINYQISQSNICID